MIQYIDKDALVAEIEKRINSTGDTNQWLCGKLEAYREIHDFLDTLEVKEVDLEKELNVIIDSLNDDKYEHLSIHQQLSHIAKHFFELGMQVNNPVTAADRGFAEEIIINLKRVENDYHLDLTREMEWLRNKTKKGE
jgi:hypothetical protein